MENRTNEEIKEHPDILKQQEILHLSFAIYVPFSSTFVWAIKLLLAFLFLLQLNVNFVPNVSACLPSALPAFSPLVLTTLGKKRTIIFTLFFR